MKNITPKLSIAMILLSTILFSCKEEVPVKSVEFVKTNNSSTSSNPNDFYGIHHNAILDYYKDSLRFNVLNRIILHNGNYLVTDSCLNNIFKSCKNYCLINGYTANQIDNVIDSINNFIYEYNLITEVNNKDAYKSIYNEIGSINSSLVINNKIDSATYEAINLVCQSVNNNNSLSFTQSIIDSLELTIQPNYENSQLGMFISIWNASSNYWDGYPTPQGINNNQKLILADAAGSLFGTLWGGVGSIVFGALASCIEAETQERGNSNWGWLE